MEPIKQAVARVVQELFGVEAGVELTRPAEQFGDYATNVALQLAGKLGKPPREIAEAIAGKLQDAAIAKADVAGPGFINITLSNGALAAAVGKATDKPQDYTGKTVVTEYSDPNPFKVLHAGHLYTSVVGDGIANLLENAGAAVHRVNFGGDVGLHVAKTMWAILQQLGGENPGELAEVPENDRAQWLSEAYITGTNAYEDDESAKAQIIDLNKRVYQIQNDGDHDSPLGQIYWTTRQWSYDYFDKFYARIGSKFEKYIPESEVAGLGLQTVREHVGTVFKESDGAIIFDGEAHGLHTRVFINSEGLPTYEAKDVGLIERKWNDYHFDLSVVITGHEQEQYMAVVLKAIEQFQPELAQKTRHFTHGLVKLQGGVKMSSRKGNILRAEDILDEAAEANHAAREKDDPDTVLGAVKYSFLKQRMGGDIIYDPNESVSLEGNSGPYLQYAHARARSILAKAGGAGGEMSDLQPGERSLARKISEFPEVVGMATNELMPHHICTYLYELAQNFNRFYEQNRVIGDERQAARLQLVAHYADVLKAGLGLLGIVAPEHM